VNCFTRAQNGPYSGTPFLLLATDHWLLSPNQNTEKRCPEFPLFTLSLHHPFAFLFYLSPTTSIKPKPHAALSLSLSLYRILCHSLTQSLKSAEERRKQKMILNLIFWVLCLLINFGLLAIVFYAVFTILLFYPSNKPLLYFIPCFLFFFSILFACYN
jgi:hypothetical protein